MLLSRVWVYIKTMKNWVLGLVIMFMLVISGRNMHCQIPAGVDTTRPVWAIRTVDSTGLSESLPMISQYNPPLVYGKWLHDIAACERLPLPTEEQVSKLTFYAVNAESFQINRDTVNILLGVVDPSLDRVYVSLPQMWDRETIQHEFVHMLLRWKYGELYANKHPSEYFTKCRMHVYRSHN